MTSAETTNQTLTSEQVRIIASGLYYIGNVDGIDAREITIIEDFLEDSGHGLTFEEVIKDEFDLVEAGRVLNTNFMRRIFLKAALLLIQADKRITSPEKDAILSVATAFGMDKWVMEEIDAYIEQEQERF